MHIRSFTFRCDLTETMKPQISMFEEVIQRSNEISYDEWVLKNDALTDEDRASIPSTFSVFLRDA